MANTKVGRDEAIALGYADLGPDELDALGIDIDDKPIEQLTSFDEGLQSFSDVGEQAPRATVPYAHPETYKPDGFREWLAQRDLGNKAVDNAYDVTARSVESGTLNDALQGFAQGASYGFADEIAGAVQGSQVFANKLIKVLPTEP